MSSSKRVLTSVIAFALVIGVTLMGCSQGTGTNAKNESTSDNTSQSEAVSSTTVEETTILAKDLPEVTLSFYFPSFLGDPLEDDSQVYTAVNKLIKEKINAAVDYKPLSAAEYLDKMSVMRAASEDYDICWTSNWFGNFQLEASKGYYLPLDDLLKDYAPELLASMSQDIWSATKLSGKIYSIPNQQIFARSAQLQVPKVFADKYGFDPSAVNSDTFRLEDLEPYLDKFAKGEPEKEKYPIRIEWAGMAGYYNIEVLAGDNVPGAINYNDKTAKVFNQFESEEFKQHLALMKKWVDNGWFKSKQLLTEGGALIQNTGAQFAGTWAPGVEAQSEQNYGLKLYCIPVSKSILNNSGILATLTAISRISKNPERAMMFLELLNNNEEIFNLLCWGIEGKHYTKSGKYITTIADAKYRTIYNWEIATTFRSYLLNGQPLDVWEQTKKVNEEAQPSPLLGFNFDLTPVKTEAANCGAVYKEYAQGLTYAILSIDKDYPIFITKLKQAGSDRIIAEMQKQIDAWMTSK